MKKIPGVPFNTSQNGNEENTNSQNLNSTELIKNEPIENTPFRLIGNEKQGYAIAVGLHRLTQPRDTIKEAMEELETKKWNIISNLIIAITDTYKKFEENLNNEFIHGIDKDLQTLENEVHKLKKQANTL